MREDRIDYEALHRTLSEGKKEQCLEKFKNCLCIETKKYICKIFDMGQVSRTSQLFV